MEVWVISETWMRTTGTRGIESHRVADVRLSQASAWERLQALGKSLADTVRKQNPNTQYEIGEDKSNNAVFVEDERTGRTVVMLSYQHFFAK